MDCGCLRPLDRHGNPDHIALPRLQRAAAASGLPAAEAAWNIPRTLAAAVHGGCPPGEDALTGHPALIWDCDGILSFTAEALCGALNARFGTSYAPLSQTFFPGTFITARLPQQQAGWVSGLLSEPAFLASFAPDFHALDTLRDAYDAGFPCQVVTERDPSVQAATADWLADWGGPAIEVHAVGHGNKPAYLAGCFGSDNAAVLLDDNPAVQITVARPGISVWTPERPYTPTLARDHVREFATWDSARYWLALGPQP